MLTMSPEEIIKGVKANSSQVLHHLYKAMRPQIQSFVQRNGGSEQDGEDLLQEGIIAFYTNVRRGTFEQRGETKVTTYINQICRYKWLDQIKSARNKTSVKMEEEHVRDYGEDPAYYQDLESMEQVNKVAQMFTALGDKCKQLLTLFYYEKKSMSEINQIMNFSGNTSKNEKYRCMKKLKTLYAQ